MVLEASINQHPRSSGLGRGGPLALAASAATCSVASGYWSSTRPTSRASIGRLLVSFALNGIDGKKPQKTIFMSSTGMRDLSVGRTITQHPIDFSVVAGAKISKFDCERGWAPSPKFYCFYPVLPTIVK